MPEQTIEEARVRLKAAKAKPDDGSAATQRRRLERALDALRKQHQWGDITTTTTERSAWRSRRTRSAARLVGRDADRLDEARARLLSLPSAIEAASDERKAEIVRLLVNRVAANREHGMTGLEWTPQAGGPVLRLVVVMEGRVGFEPTTRGLKVPCSNR